VSALSQVMADESPLPLSFILGKALNSQQSSLVLFYASLQNILYPTRTPKKSRMTPSALTAGLYPKAPTLVEHIKTASVVLRPERVVIGRTGWSTMCYCKVTKGSLGDAVLGKGPAEMDKKMEMETVLVIFQPVPTECSKLGLDPRILSLKPNSTYEMGLWGPWSTTLSGTEAEGVGDSEGENIGEEHVAGKNESGVKEKEKTVIFASRYLIAEL